MNTLFDRKASKNWTWKNQIGEIKNEIVFLLTNIINPTNNEAFFLFLFFSYRSSEKEQHRLTKSPSVYIHYGQGFFRVEDSLCICRAALLEVKRRPLVQPVHTQDQGTRLPGNVVFRYLGSEGHSVLVGHH